MNLRNGVVLAAVAAVVPIAASARDSVTRFRLSPASDNVHECFDLDANLARTHTVTVKAGDVEITSAGGIEGRMKPVRAGVYEIAFELSGLRLDVVADLAGPPPRLTVRERDHGCTWAARPE
ncbi:MAG: hypothetical protein ACHQK9_03205 [Reyranellales bacterium]